MMFGNKNIEKIAVMITKRCNLNCKYCYIIQNNQTFLQSKIDTLIDFIKKTNGKDKTIIFVGGEPLLEFSLIKEICKKLEQIKDKKIKKIINTNGTILTKDILDNINIFDVISISLDGKKESHNLNRIDKERQGSFEKIKANILKIKSNFNGDIGFNVVITSKTARDLFENVKYIYNVLNPDFIYISVASGRFDWEKEDIIELVRNCVKLIKYIKKNKIEKTFGNFDNFNRKECILNSISVDTNGDIYPCEYVIDRNITPLANINGKINYSFLNTCKFNINNLFCLKELCLNCNTICRKNSDGKLDRNLIKALNFRSLFK